MRYMQQQQYITSLVVGGIAGVCYDLQFPLPFLVYEKIHTLCQTGPLVLLQPAGRVKDEGIPV